MADLDALKAAALATLKSKQANKKKRIVVAPRDSIPDLEALRLAALNSRASKTSLQSQNDSDSSQPTSSKHNCDYGRSDSNEDNDDNLSEISLLEDEEEAELIMSHADSNGSELHEPIGVPDILQDDIDMDDLYDDELPAVTLTISSKPKPSQTVNSVSKVSTNSKQKNTSRTPKVASRSSDSDKTASSSKPRQITSKSSRGEATSTISAGNGIKSTVGRKTQTVTERIAEAASSSSNKAAKKKEVQSISNLPENKHTQDIIKETDKKASPTRPANDTKPVKKSLKERLGGFAKEEAVARSKSKQPLDIKLTVADEDSSFSDEDNDFIETQASFTKRKVYLEDSPPRELKRRQRPAPASSDDDVIPSKREMKTSHRADRLPTRDRLADRGISSRSHIWSTRPEDTTHTSRHKDNNSRLLEDISAHHRGRESKQPVSSSFSKGSYSSEMNKGKTGAELELDEKIRKIKENNAKILARQKEIEREKAMFR